MYRIGLAVAMALLLCCPLAAQQKTYDFKNLSADDIAALKADRHAFYEAKSAGKWEAIQRSMLQKAMMLDGNQVDYDIKYYGIDLYLNFTNSTISGKVDYKIESNVNGLNAVDLNLTTQLIVDSIKINNTTSFFSHSANLLQITTPTSFARFAEFDMTVYYHGSPLYLDQQGLAFGNVWGYTMLWTNCEPFGSRNWWPCKDHPEDKPDSVDIYIDYPNTYKVMSAGKIMTDVASGTGRKRIHFKHNYPVATYLVALTVSNFVSSIQTWNYDSQSMPVYAYTLPNATAAKTSFEANMLPVLTNLSEGWGTYPFITEKAGNAHYGWGGAMEHQTCSFYSPGFYDEWVIAHETGHQWFGDMITCETFNHIWLNEGFASYSEPLHFERKFGFASYKSYLQSQKYLGSGTVYVENILTDDVFDQNLVYDKGSWVVHMLRGVLGDSVFFNDAMPAYVNGPQRFNSATTAEFEAAVSAGSGQDLSWFFTEWIFGNGSPAYEIAFRCEPKIGGGYRLLYLIEQVQGGGTYFKMPIRTRFNTTGGPRDTVIWNEGAVQLYELSFADSVTGVVFDADEWILRTVLTKPFEMTVVTRTLPDGQETVPYYTTFEAVAGTPPYNWTFLGGDLPFGTIFNGGASPSITGTPFFAATFYFTIRCEDSSIPPNVRDVSYSILIGPPPSGLDGDADGNGAISIADAVFLINYIFAAGPAPNPISLGDADCSGAISIADAVFLINYIFSGGPAPNCP